jgi:hypothetical protein
VTSKTVVEKYLPTACWSVKNWQIFFLAVLLLHSSACEQLHDEQYYRDHKHDVNQIANCCTGKTET